MDIVGAGEKMILVAHGDGRGSFGRIERVAGDGWTVIAADLDGDSRVELITPDATASALRIWTPR
jgi:hypothetical protein